MNKKRCINCNGSGKVMGGGMLLADCENCDGSGKVIIIEDEIDYLFEKDKAAYQKIKSTLLEKDKNVSEQEVEKILDEEIEKQKSNKRSK